MELATNQVKGEEEEKLTRQLINTRVAMIDCHHKENLEKRNKSPGREKSRSHEEAKTEKFVETTKTNRIRKKTQTKTDSSLWLLHLLRW